MLTMEKSGILYFPVSESPRAACVAGGKEHLERPGTFEFEAQSSPGK